MSLKSLLTFILLFSSLAVANVVEGDARAQIESSRSHLTAASLRWEIDLAPGWSAQTGARLSTGWLDLDALHYKMAVTYSPLPFLFLDLGLFHAQRFRGTNATSHLWGQARLAGELVSFLNWFVSFGWYERFTRLDKVWVVPTFQGDVREHDFTVSLGLSAPLTQQWTLMTSLATFDAFEIYNLNHPYVELRSVHQVLGPATVEAYGRYQVLLGFGRLDNLTMGVAFKINIPADLKEGDYSGSSRR